MENIVDGLNATDKPYFKGEREIIAKLETNDTTIIGMLPSVSKYVLIKFVDQCLHIINIIEGLNGLKDSIKMQKRQS